MTISVSDWNAVDYRLKHDIPAGFALSVNDSLASHELQVALYNKAAASEWEAYKRTWQFSESFYLEKEFARHKDFRSGGCVYLLERSNWHFKTVPQWLLDQHGGKHG